jgi:hypothetical protein
VNEADSVGAERPAETPATHRDLAECPPVAALSTLMPNGDPQTLVVGAKATR